VRGWKKIYQVNGPKKQAGVAILTSNKVDFIFTLVNQDKERHFILIKGALHQINDNYQPIYTKCQYTQFHQTYTKGLKSTETPSQW
jgi:hypothetical protein